MVDCKSKVLPLIFYCIIQYSMLRQDRQLQKQSQQQSSLNYQGKKLLHMIQLQILDIQSTLHYIQKKHTMHQLKEALSQIYNIFNETQPLFKIIKGMFLHQEIKKIMNCFGIIYVILMDHLQNDQKDLDFGNRESQDGKKEQKELIEESNKRMSSFQQLQKSKIRLKPKALGGIHLYNERYSRHLQCDQQYRKSIQPKMAKEPTREQLNKMVCDQINDVSHINSHPDQILDIFSFKFKYGKENQIVTFHDQLLSIANFFKQSQNQAFQFLNKTKDQASMISYNDTFKDIMSQIKKEKDDKLRVFTEKIKSAFSSIKTKTEMKMAEIQTKLTQIEEVQHPKAVNKFQRETQTVYNFDEEIKSLKRRLSDSQEKYKIMMDYKKKELEQHTIIGLQLQSQIGLKNREIVYLKLNIQENELQVSSLNRKVKFLTDANRKIKDIVKTGQESKIMQIVESKEDSQIFQKQQEMNQIALQSLRKQRKMAKKILLDKRKNSLLEEKAIFMKRFTQQLDSTPKGLLSRNLSEIAEGQGSEFYDSQASMASNKNNNLYEENARPYKRKHTKKVSIVNTNQGFQSSHSIKSQHQFSKSKKVLKEKHNSEMIDTSNRTSFLNKFGTPKITEDSVLDQCSQDERDFLEGKQQSLNLNSVQLNKIQEMFKKQMNRTKNIMNSNNRYSSFNSKGNSKSYFAQKQHTQQSASISNNNTNRSKYSFRSSKPEEESKSLQKPAKKIENLQEQKAKIAEETKRKVEKRGTVSLNLAKKAMSFCSTQVSVNICPLKVKAEQSTQTQQKNYTQQDDETQYTQIKNPSNLGNYVHIPKTKDAILPNQQPHSQLITRSATQSKMSKNRHLKTLYTISKQNDRYIFPFSKHPEKSEEEVFKNSQSCLQMNEEAHRQVQQAQNEKRDSAHQSQKIKQEQQMRKLVIKCRTLQQFKARVAQMHKSKCGNTCKHLQKFIQNYIKYKQQQKPKVKIALKNLNDNIASPYEQDNYLPLLDKKKI